MGKKKDAFLTSVPGGDEGESKPKKAPRSAGGDKSTSVDIERLKELHQARIDR